MRETASSIVFAGAGLVLISVPLLAATSSGNAKAPASGAASCCTAFSVEAAQAASPPSQSQSHDPADRERRRLAAWESYLAKVSQLEDRPIVTAIPQTNWPPAQPKRAHGTGTLALLQLVLQSRYEIVDGTVAFRRVLDSSDSARHAGRAAIGDWLKSASDADIEAATDRKGLPLRSVSDGERLEWLAGMGLTQDMMEGFVSAGDQGRLFVRFAIDLVGTDSKGKPVQYRVQSPVPAIRDGGQMAEQDVDPIPADALERKGELQFGAGKVLSVVELRQFVKERTKHDIEVDPRLDGSRLFLSGGFVFESLLSSIKIALNVPLAIESDESQALDEKDVDALVHDRLRALLDSFSEETGVPSRWAMERRTMSAAALTDKVPGLSAFLQSRGIDPSTLQLTLVPTVLFNAWAPGSTTAPNPDPNLPAITYKHNFSFAYHPGSKKA